jgi:rifampicin phosphotransferase
MMRAMSNDARFTPPGPGSWQLEMTHFVRPVSRSMAATFPEAMMAGFRWSTKRYGSLLDYLEIKVVNRFVYMAPRGVGAPPDAKSHPPKLMFQLLTKVHPEIRKRIKTVAEVFATKRWRADVALWDTEWKPAFVREHQELQNVDVRALSDDALIAHVAQAFDAARRAIQRHHSMNATAMLPVGDFLAHVREWTGLAPADVLPIFQGSSRVSRGAADEIDAVGRAIQASAVAQAILAQENPQVVVDALLARTDAVGDAMRRYIDVAGTRLATGYDLADLTLSEMPELIVENVRSAASSVVREQNESGVARLEKQIRERVPAQHRATFDELLQDARLVYRIRDERGYLNDAWACGIARRAILEAGMRLVRKGLLHEVHHAVELTPDELMALLAGGKGPSADETAEHARYRTTHTIADAPAFLGNPPSAPPPAEWLPPMAARAERAIGIVMGEMFAAHDKQTDAAKINGFAASHGIVTGIARLVLEPRDMGRVRKGDVLITRSTSPAYNALLPLLLGVVTDRGGTLSHAAVVAREYGIPAVVGTGNATERIRDGARIRVNGAIGLVELLA